ncbi:spore germination protein [Paenibacillus sp. HWE-109]|uniref:spore germination protein n=1 Tax=Paenibacillus sp. HWE-109 TaxID=1306526 RepID=UPI001EDDCB0D|nr:spore germination protein [Paenibacillus sp. HWE-109]UKS28745.1 spore germination protein [Paenibacillus sp. HWE-109]
MSFFDKLLKGSTVPAPPPLHQESARLQALADLQLSTSLEENLAAIKETIQHASDLIVREIILQSEENLEIRAVVMYIDGLAEKDIVHQCVILPLMKMEQTTQITLSYIENYVITASGIKRETTLKESISGLLYSSTLLIIDGFAESLLITSEGWEHRFVSKPTVEPIIRGPQDAFNEVLRTNTALIRRKIKDPQLVFYPIQIGTRTLTDGVVAYLQDVANPSIVKEVKRRLSLVDTEGILDSGQLEDYLEDSPRSPFPQVSSTERADKAAAALLEGKIVVLVDGTPFALLMPITFPEFLLSTEDYYTNYLAVTMLRWVRFFAIMMALMLPSIYIAITSYHQEMLPTQLMLAIAANRSGIPFPAFFEALIMEISLELLREASLRLPGSMGQTIGIVGALVIGQAAVQANIVGPVLTIIVSFTAIGTFVIPNYNASLAIRFLRFPLMVLAAVFGIFGIVFGTSMILIHMIHLRSFGVSYLATLTPQTLSAVDDSFIFKKPSYALNYRQRFLGLKKQKP